MIAWLTLHWFILPHIQQWREPIESRAGKALGIPVKIGRIEVRSGGWVPSFELHDVQLFDAAQRPALRLPQVFAAISPRSLLSLQLRFEQLLIDGAQLEVRRSPEGRIFVAGLDVSGEQPGDGSSAASDWFFKQHEFVVRGGSVRWTDEQRGAAPLALTDVQFVVRNGLRHHDFRLDATPPVEWGDRFNIAARMTQPLLARAGDWQRWSGAIHVELPRADLHALREHVSLPVELTEGVGALRGWIEMKAGEPEAATVDLALRAVTVRLANDVEPLVVREVEGRLEARRASDGVALVATGFGLVTGDGTRWPSGDMKLTLQRRDGGPVEAGEFSAQRLDLGSLAQLAASVPLGDALRTLRELRPQGSLAEFRLGWEGPAEAPTRYRTRGTLTALALEPRASDVSPGLGRPGLRGANVRFDATEAGGEARVDIEGGRLELPGVLADPSVPINRLDAKLQWRIEPATTAETPATVTLQIDGARFANADAGGELTARWQSTPRGPGHLKLDGTLSRGVAARMHRYLPLEIPKDTRDYVEHSVRSGRITSASFHVDGALSEFPFRGPRAGNPPADKGKADTGEFRIAAKIDGASVAFVAGAPARAGTPASPSRWPTLSDVGVALVIDRDTLELRDGRASLGKLEWTNAQGTIRPLGDDARVSLATSVSGPLAEMIAVVNASPVGGWIGDALKSATANGAATLRLNLEMPLEDLDRTSVTGSVALTGNDLRLTPDSPLLAGAEGRIDFTEQHFAIVGASANLYGGPARFDGGMQPDGSIRINGQGTLGAQALRSVVDGGALARLATSLSGQAAYRAEVGLVHGQLELEVTSDLVGMASELPAPLDKAAETPLAMRFENRIDPASLRGQRAARDTLQFELGERLQVHYLRDISGAQPRVLNGGVGVFAPAPQPASGVTAHVVLKRFETDPWEAVADRLTGNAESPDAQAAGGYAPDAIALQVQELVAGQRRLTNVSAGLSRQAGEWRANVDADQLDGYIEYRLPSRRGGAATAGGRVYARLARLSLPKSDVEQVESLLDQQPASLPALDIVVDDFELRGKKFGRVEVEAVNRSTGRGRDAVFDWQLTRFNVSTPEAQLIASGLWSAAGGAPSRGSGVAARRSVMDFRLLLSDSGALLARLGTPGAIRGGRGEMSGKLEWTGSPFALDYPSLAGKVKIAIDAGQFLKADPGAARLLGVLSLQSLPRRLSLDFRDLFQQGFAFDSVNGDVTIARGVAQTNNLRMRGVQAVVLMEGSADIERETQDLRVIVVPEINAGTAALAYAAINPAIGLGAFLAQAILRKPLMQAGTREFHVSGSWSDPAVERVARRFDDELPSIDTPPEPAAKAGAASAPTQNP